jgi:hypothetical protein
MDAWISLTSENKSLCTGKVKTIMKNFKLNTKTIIIGVIIFIAAMFFLPQILGGDDEDEPNTVSNTSNEDEANDNNTDDNIALGEVVSAEGVDRDGCAVDITSDFDTSDSIYIVAESGDFPEGTAIFVRLYRDDSPVEDSPEITADQDYNNACVNFVFEPEAGEAFDPGDYEAEFYINGNPAESVSFEIG